MSKWKMVRLGDAATYVNGMAFKPTDWDTTGLPIIRIQNLTEGRSEIHYFSGSCPEKYLINQGDVLISWSATLGVYIWNNEKAVLNQHIFKVIFDKLEFDKRYFVYIVGQKINEMSQNTHGSTMKHIIKKYFDAIEIPLPPLDEQKRIADVLDKASELIKKRKEQIRLMDEIAKSLFIEMFGDPVENPMGWDVISLSSCVVSIENGHSPICNNIPRVDKKFGVLKLSAVTYGTYNEYENKALLDGTPFNSKIEVHNSDLLVSRKNTYELVGVSAYVWKTNPGLMMSDLIFRLNTIDNVNKIYLWKLINHKSIRENIKKLASGSAGSMPNISKYRLMGLLIPLPPISLQNEFADRIEAIEQQKTLLQDGLAKMETAYKALMQEYFG